MNQNNEDPMLPNDLESLQSVVLNVNYEKQILIGSIKQIFIFFQRIVNNNLDTIIVLEIDKKIWHRNICKVEG